MRRQGQYADSGVNAYVAAQMHHASGQRMDNKPDQFEGRLEAFTPERDNPYVMSKTEGQWRWERDGSKMSNSLNSQIFNEGQGGDSARPYFQDQRPDMKMASEKQSNSDTRSQPRKEDMDIGYEESPLSQTFQGLEQKFLDDIMKLAKEQNDAEDAENVRHREKINAINAQYEEQLAALRARHANHRDEFLRRESSTRQQQYQQAVVDRYPNSSVVPNDPHGYTGFPVSATAADAHRSYDTEHYDSYRERARFLGGTRDHGFEPRGPYPGGRVYDTGSRYY
ncbi:ubiquitin carboxyl-terminal hydrolase [Parasponia andersonii]|uniref:Ubiquitin carboxyl-terminal hydrolase n=1 Tax=Parasponia andersonii TaxID=3476 RepID=A0A2P5BQ08_PARAD|nr:ubiquitin carboxyl-terminal hydrolase [Parasponia andersonii]